MDSRPFKRFNNAAGLFDLTRSDGRTGCYNAGLQKMRLDQKECFHLREASWFRLLLDQREFPIHSNLIYQVKTQQTRIKGALIKI